MADFKYRPKWISFEGDISGTVGKPLLYGLVPGQHKKTLGTVLVQNLVWFLNFFRISFYGYPWNLKTYKPT